MATLVCFHAHPDDESSQTSGLLARAAKAGHRAIVVTATDGAQGEVHTELAPGETLAERRASELAEALAVIGAEPPRMLGYPDSGMMGEASNDDPECFYQADIDTAAARLAEILRDVDADVLTIYDDHGGYGHPDHIQVHRVGRRAAEMVGLEHVYEVTMNRDRIQDMMKRRAEMLANDDPGEVEIDPTHEHLADVDAEQLPSDDMMATIGTPEADISFAVDVTDLIGTKREALRRHASQMPPDNMFMTMPDEMFAAAFGYEHFNVPGVTATGGPVLVETLPGLDGAS